MYIVRRNRQDEESCLSCLRSWVQIPPGSFLSTRKLRYYFELVFGSCRVNLAVTTTTGQLSFLDGLIGVGLADVDEAGNTNVTLWEFETGIPYVKNWMELLMMLHRRNNNNTL